MKKKLSRLSRILLLLAAIALVFVLFTPIWRIDLDAPQYPEGLRLQIHATGLQGNVDIVNGLNHYIGMKTLHNEDFIEFKVLPYCIIFFVILFAVTAFVGKRRLLNISFLLFVAFGVIAIYDFWRWEYDYGHNLNPNAAIVVPGMAYQPPLIGFKQLLNFGAYSIPDIGGWLFIGGGVLLLVCLILEWRTSKKTAKKLQAAIILLPLAFNSCASGPQPIAIGVDNCYFCKMTISDPKYGAELETKKGKLFKFDDIHCLLGFRKAGMIEEKEVKEIYLVDFTGKHLLFKADEGYLLRGGEIHGPMNGDIIAFQNKDSLNGQMNRWKATSSTWQEIQK
jgi:copper chaperone NosL